MSSSELYELLAYLDVEKYEKVVEEIERLNEYISFYEDLSKKQNKKIERLKKENEKLEIENNLLKQLVGDNKQYTTGIR